MEKSNKKENRLIYKDEPTYLNKSLIINYQPYLFKTR